MEDLVNLRDHTPTELVLFATGCYMWVVVYMIYLYRIMKHRNVGMPLVAACANFAWEFVWSWVTPLTDMGPLLVWCYRGWFFLDIFIFIGILKYGAWQIATPLIKRYHYILLAGLLLFFSFLFYGMKTMTVGSPPLPAGLDTPIGANSAYMCQMLISGYYVLLIFRASAEEFTYFSHWATWLRTIGTGLNDIFMFIHYPENTFLHTMCVASFLLDCLFIYLLYRRPAALLNAQRAASTLIEVPGHAHAAGV
jgi:hypothetical protein